MEKNSNSLVGGSYIRPFVVEGEMTREPREIRIIDGSYNEKFCVPDGGYITVDGTPYQLHYVDETHFSINGTYWNICQFGERVVDRGRDVRKMEEEQS
ncbi:MAG: hypothetical protein LBC14_00405 [Desulfovibrio sp.]|jgi:hypothetical protein|nr:hypothetical protein [Desulfovibrio sp.]